MGNGGDWWEMVRNGGEGWGMLDNYGELWGMMGNGLEWVWNGGKW